MTRVLLVSHTGQIGGAEQVLLSIARHLPEFGVEPAIACLRPGPLSVKATQQGTPVFVYREHRFRDVDKVCFGMIWLARLTKRIQADVLHSNHVAHLYSGPASRLAHVPEIWHLYDHPGNGKRWSRWVEKMTSAHMVFTTNHVKSGYLHLCGRPHSIIPPTCVEPDQWRSLTIRSDVRERLKLPTGPLFLTVTRLQAHKGHRYLLQAVPHILKQYPDAIFAIAGKASEPNQVHYLNGLLTEVSDKGLTRSVYFLGFVDDEDLASLYRQAAALIHPALNEGFGLTLLEAMSLGTPVIAAAAEGPQEIIQDKVNGMLVPKADGMALAEAAITLLQQPDLRETLQSGGTRYLTSADTPAMVRQIVAVYKSLLT